MKQYIDKSALVAEIERIMAEEISFFKDCCKDGLENTTAPVVYTRMEMLLSFLDTLEVIKIGVDEGDPKGDKSAKYILDTKNLEVKEVDLDKEVRSSAVQYDINNSGHIYWEDIVGFAKHFYELGLKAQKGE